jgi:hypothetical protein
MKLQRHVTVSTVTAGTYTAVNPNLTDVDLLIADQSLEDFSQTTKQADTACSNQIGLVSVICTDVNTCTRLCSSASQKCRRIADEYKDELGGAMISYVAANNEMKSLILDARRMVYNLRETTDEDRNVFLGKTRGMVATIADINANPLYTHPDLQLCSPSDFGINYLLDAAKKIGTYRTETTGYHYRMMLSVKPLEPEDGNGIGKEIGGVKLTDSVPTMVVPDTNDISSIQRITSAEDAGNIDVSWSSASASEVGYLLVYEFDSTAPPENVLSSLKTPELSVRTVDLSGLIPTNMVLVLTNDMLGNYFLALGIAVGITVAALFFAYNIVVLIFTVLSERLAGATITTGFRKAFGRTEVRWKSDLVFAAVFLIAGIYVSMMVATPPLEAPPLMQMVDFLLESGWGALGVTLVMLGTVMAYFSVENIAKIILLEKAYGRVMRSERDAFLAKADTLKEKIGELQKLVEAYSAENFDVSHEYDVLTAVRAAKIDALTKNMTARSKTLLDEHLTKTERAVGSLQEKKRLADENWPKWKGTISKLLEERDEVFVSSLVTVPASLRSWALSRYAKEENMLLERDSIKKVKVTPEKLVREMIKKGLIKGAIVIKNEKLLLHEFSEGSGTIVTALALKLRTHLRSLAKNLGQHQPQSFVAVGGRTVIVMMKNRGLESVLFVKRAKFNEAIEQWKSKTKAFEAA